MSYNRVVQYQVRNVAPGLSIHCQNVRWTPIVPKIEKKDLDGVVLLNVCGPQVSFRVSPQSRLQVSGVFCIQIASKVCLFK